MGRFLCQFLFRFPDNPFVDPGQGNLKCLQQTHQHTHAHIHLTLSSVALATRNMHCSLLPDPGRTLVIQQSVMLSRCPNKPNKCKYDTCWECKRNKGRTIFYFSSLFSLLFFFVLCLSIQFKRIWHACWQQSPGCFVCQRICLLSSASGNTKAESENNKNIYVYTTYIYKYIWLFMRLYWKILIYLPSKTAATRSSLCASAACWHSLGLYATKSKHINAIINRDLLELTLPALPMGNLRPSPLTGIGVCGTSCGATKLCSTSAVKATSLTFRRTLNAKATKPTNCMPSYLRCYLHAYIHGEREREGELYL